MGRNLVTKQSGSVQCPRCFRLFARINRHQCPGPLQERDEPPPKRTAEQAPQPSKRGRSADYTPDDSVEMEVIDEGRCVAQEENIEELSALEAFLQSPPNVLYDQTIPLLRPDQHYTPRSTRVAGVYFDPRAGHPAPAPPDNQNGTAAPPPPRFRSNLEEHFAHFLSGQRNGTAKGDELIWLVNNMMSAAEQHGREKVSGIKSMGDLKELLGEEEGGMDLWMEHKYVPKDAVDNDDVYLFYYKNPWLVFKRDFGNPAFKDKLGLGPTSRFTADGERCFDELTDGRFWHEQQVSLLCLREAHAFTTRPNPLCRNV